jgi:hypothetical protein
MGGLATPATLVSCGTLAAVDTIRLWEKFTPPQFGLHISPIASSEAVQVDVIVLPIVVGDL